MLATRIGEARDNRHAGTGELEELGPPPGQALLGEVVGQAQVGRRLGRAGAAQRRQVHALDLQVLRQQQLQLRADRDAGKG